MPDNLSFGGMEEEEDLATTVLTCEGDITDPGFPCKLQRLVTKLQHLISDEKSIQVTKVEPWNSVRITFNIPLEAAQRLRQLAERGDSALRELGILSVQIEGDQVITLTLAGQFNETQEIVLRKTNEGQDSVSINLPTPAEAVSGPSTSEAAHKNISQFLEHIVGGAAAATPAPADVIVAKTSDHQVNFRSPNVIAPSSAEPIPFLSRSAVTTVATSSVLRMTSTTATSKSQTGFGPFPFASMTHAMNTKHASASPQFPSAINSATVRPQAVTSATLQKSSPVFNNIVSRVTTPNAVVPVSRANVALSSPLLVNLLQSETSNIQGHNKLMPPPTLVVGQCPKRKRKTRKPKDKASEEASDSIKSSSIDPPNNFTQSFTIPLSSSASSAFYQLSKAKTATIHMQSANIHPQAQGQPPVSTMHVQLQGQLSKRHPIQQGTRGVLSTTVPNIHPQAQGQPQVHTGNLPLHSHIPVGSPQVVRPSGNTYAISTSSTPASISRMVLSTSKELNPNKCATEIKSSDKRVNTPETNPFPSPPSSGDGKTKHLINPFTGQLEPMPSDEEEEEDESIGSLPPFPEFEVDTSENGQSERSLSDGGKDNNHSSDTDSGISKSHTDISQSSNEGADPSQDSKKQDSEDVSLPIEKLKLRLKLDHKCLRESEKKKECNSLQQQQSNQKVDVALANLPNLKKGEPRVPPLHISLRGPNAAVVVSPRKDDAKSRVSSDHGPEVLSSKMSASKTVRSPRGSKTVTESLMPGRIFDSKKVKCGNLKKGKDDYWNQNVKNMSGGGIVEMSEKLQNYETYLSDFKKVAQTSCKSEVITLTSCATGESVSIRAPASANATLPFHVVVGGAESASMVPVTAQQAAQPVVQIPIVDKVLKGKPFGNSKNHLKDVVAVAPESRSAKKDNSSLSAPRRPSQPYMQRSSLPHSTGGKVDKSKVTVSVDTTSSSGDLPQRTIATGVPFVPPATSLAVPAIASVTTTSVAGAISTTGQMTGHSLMDANKSLSDNVTNSPESQCNTNPEDPSTPSEVQNRSAFSNSNSTDSYKKTVVVVADSSSASESVQIGAPVNSTDQTANHFDMNNDVCKAPVFSTTFIERCRSPLVNFISAKKREKIQEVVGGPDNKKVRVIEMKQTPPIAQIITLDSQSRVIEVPSHQSMLSTASLEVNHSDLMSSIPSLIPSDGGDSSFRSCEKTADPMDSSVSSSSVDKPAEEDRNSSAVASEESSMDSIDEERQRCLAENKTSTPGPPNEDVSSKSNCSKSNSNSSVSEAKNISVAEVTTSSTKVESTSEATTLPLPAPVSEPCVDIAASKSPPSTEQQQNTLVSVTTMEVVHQEVAAEKPNKQEAGGLMSSLKTANVQLLPSDKPMPIASASNATPTKCPAESQLPSNRTVSVNKAETSTESSSSTSVTSSSEYQSKAVTGKSVDTTPIVCTSSSLAVASYIPQARLQSQDGSTSSRVRLIFKGGAQHSVLSSCSSPTGFVLPLNSTKTVPIKLVTLPAGAAVRSTSNPNVVEIIGANANPSHSVSSSGNIHRSSPVRLVVSKMSPGSGSTSNVSPGARGRMVVKSVVVSGSSSSLKISSAKGDLCTTLPISTASSVIAVASSSSSSTAGRTNNSVTPDLVKPSDGVESSLMTTEDKAKSKSKSETDVLKPLSTATTLTTVPSVQSSPLKTVEAPTTQIKTADVVDKSKRVDNDEERSNKSLDEGVANRDLKIEVSNETENKVEESKTENSTPAEVAILKLEEPQPPPLVDKKEMEEGISATIDLKVEEQTVKEENVMNDLPTMDPSSESSIQNQPYIVGKEVTVESESLVIDKNCSHDVVKNCNTTLDCYNEVVIDPSFLFEEEVGPSPRNVVTNDDVEVEEVDAIVADDDDDDGDDEKKEIRPKLDGEASVERNRLAISLVYSKPVKRKCSENAAELIKACMGVEDSPKRSLILVPEVEVKCAEKIEPDEVVRTALRVKRETPVRKIRDCSSEDELTLSELMNKTRTRERPSRSRLLVNRESPMETLNSRPLRRRSGSNESIKSDDLKLKGKDLRRDVKKLPERTKRGVNKGQTVQRNTDNDVKPSALNTREETKRKTRSTEKVEEGVKRRSYSKDNHR